MKFYVISEDELAKLRALRTRLHSERKMSGDDMRDAGHTLDSVIRVCESIPLSED